MTIEATFKLCVSSQRSTRGAPIRWEPQTTTQTKSQTSGSQNTALKENDREHCVIHPEGWPKIITLWMRRIVYIVNKLSPVWENSMHCISLCYLLHQPWPVCDLSASEHHPLHQDVVCFNSLWGRLLFLLLFENDLRKIELYWFL